tara:strand:+ start:9820 stop:10971 length:1152 start_codon:yes stop_codon:yes gene_type:complete
MGNTNLAEGHLKTATGVSYQADGLRDTDVLTSPTLTNFVERGFLNGIVPVTMSAYNNTARNDANTGNCVVRLVGSLGSANQVIVDAGTVCLDGMFYSVSQTTYTVSTNTANLDSTHSGSAISNPSGANEEAIMLVYIDPSKNNNIGLIYGSFVDTASGLFPSSPSAHLNQQSIVLASIRVGKGASAVVIVGLEDKRTFFRPGPYPLAKQIHSDGSAAHIRNDHIAGFNAANLPITGLGHLYARDPAGFHGGVEHGSGQTHLFYQGDQGSGTLAGGGGSYQLTPVHRVSRWEGTYSSLTTGQIVYGSTILFAPLRSEEVGQPGYLVNIQMYANTTGGLSRTLIQGVDYTVAADKIVIAAPSGWATAAASLTHIHLTYVHACHHA